MTTTFPQTTASRTSIVLAPARYPIDLDDPTCTVCGYRAVGMVESETNGDHERRDSF